MNNVEAIANEIDLSEWTEEGQRQLMVIAKIINELSNICSFEDMDIYYDFLNSNEFATFIQMRMLEKKFELMGKGTCNYDEPLAFYTGQLARLKEYLEQKIK